MIGASINEAGLVIVMNRTGLEDGTQVLEHRRSVQVRSAKISALLLGSGIHGSKLEDLGSLMELRNAVSLLAFTQIWFKTCCFR